MKILSIILGLLGALAGGRAGYGAMSRSDPVYVSYVLANPHPSWNLLSWLRFFEPVIGGALVGGAIFGLVLPQIARRVKWAALGVRREHLLVGTLCGLAWLAAAIVVLAGPLTLVFFTQPSLALVFVLYGALGGVLGGAMGASLLTHLVHVKRKTSVGVGWAALGGLLGGPIGLSLALLLVLAAYP